MRTLKRIFCSVEGGLGERPKPDGVAADSSSSSSLVSATPPLFCCAYFMLLDAPENVFRWPFTRGAESCSLWFERGAALLVESVVSPFSILICFCGTRSACLGGLPGPLFGEIADDTVLRIPALFLIDPLLGLCVCFGCLPVSLSYAALVCLFVFAGCNSSGMIFVLPDLRLPPSTNDVGPSAFGRFHGFGSSFFADPASFRRFADGPSPL